MLAVMATEALDPPAADALSPTKPTCVDILAAADPPTADAAAPISREDTMLTPTLSNNTPLSIYHLASSVSMHSSCQPALRLSI